MIEHINETNKEYDVIIRLRFDQVIYWKQSILNQLVDNQIFNFTNKDYDCSLVNNSDIEIEEKKIRLENMFKDNKIDFTTDLILDNAIYLFGFGINKNIFGNT